MLTHILRTLGTAVVATAAVAGTTASALKLGSYLKRNIDGPNCGGNGSVLGYAAMAGAGAAAATLMPVSAPIGLGLLAKDAYDLYTAKPEATKPELVQRMSKKLKAKHEATKLNAEVA